VPKEGTRAPDVTRPHLRTIVVALALGIGATGVTALFSRTPFAADIENRSYDFRVARQARPADPSSPIVIIEINESSVRGLEPVVGPTCDGLGPERSPTMSSSSNGRADRNRSSTGGRSRGTTRTALS
jgi:hypothetical protein